jgi:hypothetical protein
MLGPLFKNIFKRVNHILMIGCVKIAHDLKPIGLHVKNDNAKGSLIVILELDVDVEIFMFLDEFKVHFVSVQFLG